MRQQPPTTNEEQAPDLGQAHLRTLLVKHTTLFVEAL